MKTAMRTTLLAAMVLCMGACATTKRTMPGFPSGPDSVDWDEKALSIAVDGFYRAESMKDAQAAVDSAVKIAPEAPVTHEIQGHLEAYRGNEEAAWGHFYAALAGRHNDAPLAHLLFLLQMPMTTSQYREAMGLFEDIVESHPNHNLRRVVAAYLSSWARRLDGGRGGGRAGPRQTRPHRGLRHHQPLRQRRRQGLLCGVSA